MSTPVRRVIDVYHDTTIYDLSAVKAAGVWGVIHKASEGTGFVDSKYLARARGFLELGLLFGGYHMLHPGNIAAQLALFLRVTGIDKNMLYALDWETTAYGTPSAAEAKQFLQLLEQKTGRKGVVYSGNVAKEQISGHDSYFGAHRLWLAEYGSKVTLPASWSDVWLWQYSADGAGPQPWGCPGVVGNCDASSWTGTQAELQAQWSGLPPVPAPPTPVVTSAASAESAAATETEDATVGPAPPPTMRTVEVTITHPSDVTVNIKQVEQ